MFAAVIAALMMGYPVVFTLAGVGIRLRAGRASVRRLRSQLFQRAAAALLGHPQQRCPDRGAAVHLYGRDAGALRHRRGFAAHAGRGVRTAAWRARILGDPGRVAARGLDRHRRRDRHHHGADLAAGDAAHRLQQGTGRRADRRHRHAGADHPAVDRAGVSGGHHADRQQPGAACQGQFHAGDAFGRRSVRGRVHSGPDPVRPLRAVGDRHDHRQTRFRAAHGDGARARPLSKGGGGAGADAAADRCGAGLDHRRRRDADRGRLGRRDGGGAAHHGADDRQRTGEGACRRIRSSARCSGTGSGPSCSSPRWRLPPAPRVC